MRMPRCPGSLDGRAVRAGGRTTGSGTAWALSGAETLLLCHHNTSCQPRHYCTSDRTCMARGWRLLPFDGSSVPRNPCPRDRCPSSLCGLLHHALHCHENRGEQAPQYSCTRRFCSGGFSSSVAVPSRRRDLGTGTLGLVTETGLCGTAPDARAFLCSRAGGKE